MSSDNEVIILGVGLVAGAACAPSVMSRDKVEAEVNIKAPTGIPSRWSIAEETHFRTGEENGGVCPKHADRRHWLLHC